MKQVVCLAAIFITVFYLLYGFMTALDAIAFQDRVLRVVGDNNIDRARAVLTKLDELDGQASVLQPADGGGLPIGTLALQLDRVKLVTADLARFNNALLPPTPRPEGSEANEAHISQMSFI